MGERRIAEQGKKRMGTPAFFATVALSVLVVAGGAVMLGKSDTGQIDVSATIRNSNQANIDDGDSSNNIGVVSNALRDMPNGGLQPQENQESNPPTPPPPEEMSTSTDATSTPEALHEAGEEEPEPVAETSEGDTQNGGE